MNEEWWKAIVESNPSYDGVFYYGVITTKVFCKPSCASRVPKREHVRIFTTSGEAVLKGFRACKRCRPEEAIWYAYAEIVSKIQQLIETQYAEAWSLASFGQALNMSPYHVQRTYSRATGLSPTRALLNKRLAVAMSKLSTTNDSVTAIALDVGFRSNAHFASVFSKHNGCSPTEYRIRHTTPAVAASTAWCIDTQHAGSTEVLNS